MILPSEIQGCRAPLSKAGSPARGREAQPLVAHVTVVVWDMCPAMDVSRCSLVQSSMVLLPTHKRLLVCYSARSRLICA
jgi:hypothetical protein